MKTARTSALTLVGPDRNTLARRRSAVDQRTCSVEECSTSILARGWCNKHYKRWRRHGSPTARWAPVPAGEPLEKPCSRCNRVLPAESFWRRKRIADGRQSACKECMSEADRLRLYGLTREDYERLMRSQGERCAICLSSPDRPLVVDHCHATGRVRGLLCGRCNSAIGLMDDDPTRASRAAEYLN